MSNQTTYRVVLSYACYAVFVDEKGIIVDAAPIAKWAVGKTLKYFTAWVGKKKGTIAKLEDLL